MDQEDWGDVVTTDYPTYFPPPRWDIERQIGGRVAAKRKDRPDFQVILYAHRKISVGVTVSTATDAQLEDHLDTLARSGRLWSIVDADPKA